MAQEGFEVVTNERERRNWNSRFNNLMGEVEEPDDGRGGSDFLSSKDLDTHKSGKNPNSIPIGKFTDWENFKEKQFMGMTPGEMKILASKIIFDLSTHKPTHTQKKNKPTHIPIGKVEDKLDWENFKEKQFMGMTPKEMKILARKIIFDLSTHEPTHIPLGELDWDKFRESQFEGMKILPSNHKDESEFLTQVDAQHEENKQEDVIDQNPEDKGWQEQHSRMSYQNQRGGRHGGRRGSRQRRAGNSRVRIPLHRFLKEEEEYDDGKEEEYDYDDARGGADVLATDFDTNLSKPKEEEEYDDGRGEGGDVLDLSRFSWEVAKCFSPLSPFGETDEESCDGDEVYGDDEKSEDEYEVVPADTPWSRAIEDLRKEVFGLPMEEDKKEVPKLLKSLETTPFSLSSGLRPPPPVKKSIKYDVYVDAYFKKDRLPRYGILVKDPYQFGTFGYVGKSKSRKVPQLQTHLEGLFQGAKLVKGLIGHKPHHDGELDIRIFSNNPYVVDFASVTSEKPLKKEHFTEDVKTLLRDLVLYTFQNNMRIEHTSHFKNSPADYLARSPTSKLWEQIPKKDFDKELKDQINLIEEYEAVKRRRREAQSQKNQVKRSYLTALLSET